MEICLLPGVKSPPFCRGVSCGMAFVRSDGSSKTIYGLTRLDLYPTAYVASGDYTFR